ncbi:MAG: methyltransferase domain-containing protein [Actinomycetota bacterium]
MLESDVVAAADRPGAADADDDARPTGPTPTSASPLRPPSIWVGSFERAEDWHRAADARDAVWRLFDSIDDRVLASRHPFTIRGHCVVCDAVMPMAMAWHLGGVNPAGSVNPAWTLNACCEGCGLVSRMRALADFLFEHGLVGGATFLAERLTTSHDRLAEFIDDLTASEWLGAERRPGDVVDVGGIAVRHEDLADLSFDDERFDLVVTQDVFEHVPSLEASFAEIVRVLRPGGRLVFTVPCFAELDRTEVLARVHPDGRVEQLVEPPEIHGNPVGDGSLCLRHIGWDVLDQLRDAGFATARAHCYWGPWAGHLGGPSFVYDAAVAD